MNLELVNLNVLSELKLSQLSSGFLRWTQKSNRISQLFDVLLSLSWKA